MKYLNLPNEIIREIYCFDFTYKEKFKNVVNEFVNLMKHYDKLFYRYHMVNHNVWAKDNEIIKWLEKHGVNYDPIRWILKKSNRINYIF